MKDADSVAFLQWALPRLHLRWAGFRRVRRRVHKRIQRRMRELELEDVQAYRKHLEAVPGEWPVLESLCRITISRFWRDRPVFDALADTVLPELAEKAQAEGRGSFECWSAGCASGEEVYTMSLLWGLRLTHRFVDLPFTCLGTDVDPWLIQRAETGHYGWSSVKELPDDLLHAGLEERDDMWIVRDGYRRSVAFSAHDVRDSPPGEFDLVLCRNLVCTYFDESLQCRVLEGIRGSMRPGGALVIGLHEELPEGVGGFVPWEEQRAIYRRTD